VSDDLSSSMSPLSLDKDQGLSDMTRVSRDKGDATRGRDGLRCALVQVQVLPALPLHRAQGCYARSPAC
jgi:hypothetical protein